MDYSWIANKYSDVHVNIFSNNRDITNCHKFLHDDDNNEAKAIAIPQVFFSKKNVLTVALPIILAKETTLLDW